MPVATEKQILEVEEAARNVWYNYYKDIFSVEQIDYMLDKYQSKEALRSQLAQGYIYYMILSDGEFAGYMCIYTKSDYVHVARLYIKAEYRRQGLARRALAHIESVFAKPEIGYSHIKRIILRVERDNSFAINVYKHLGFGIIGKEDVDIGGGFVCKEYIMERWIRRG